jgi:hypothetical protein
MRRGFGRIRCTELQNNIKVDPEIIYEGVDCIQQAQYLIQCL